MYDFELYDRHLFNGGFHHDSLILTKARHLPLPRHTSCESEGKPSPEGLVNLLFFVDSKASEVKKINVGKEFIV